jgi:hypothetical protein
MLGAVAATWWLVAATSSVAETEPSDEVAPTPRAIPESDPECDALFGDAELQATNEQRRMLRLRMVEAGPAYIDIVQNGGWDDPTEIAIRGVELISTGYGDHGEPEALVRVTPALGFCEPGEYAVQVDDALGEAGRILAILDDLVLLERNETLRYIRGSSYVGKPIFKLSWQSAFSIAPPTQSPRSKARARVGRRRRRK